jgi:leucyl aminopeptidase (aminopeptidase T)
MYEEDMEKFAELIVRECVKLQHRNVIVGGGVSAYNMGRRDLAEDILKHFGVES